MMLLFLDKLSITCWYKFSPVLIFVLRIFTSFSYLFIYNTALYIKSNKVIKKEKIKWEKVHDRKIEHLRKLQSSFTRPKARIISNIIHNFSSYHSTPQEYVLSFSLDHYIPTKVKEKKTEFESFFYQVQKYISSLDQQIQDELKTKIRRTCENYSKVKVLYKY